VIRLLAASFAVLALSAALAVAAPPTSSTDTGASAYLVRITAPGRDPVSLGELDWPASPTADIQSFQYPDDGSVLSVGRSSASVFASGGAAATSRAQANVIVVSLFAGEIVAAQVGLAATAGASVRSALADVTTSQVQGLHDAARSGAGSTRDARSGQGKRPSDPVLASAIDFVLEGLYAQRKISRSTEGQFQAAEQSKPRAPRTIDPLAERDLPLGNKKKYYN
jgi:hypothetical protein